MIDLKAAREARGWETEQMAAYLGVHPASYRNWEAGRRAPPDMLDRLTYVLALVEALAPAIHASLLPGPSKPRGRPSRRRSTTTIV